MDKFETFCLCTFQNVAPYDLAQTLKQLPPEAWEWIRATVDEAMAEKEEPDAI